MIHTIRSLWDAVNDTRGRGLHRDGGDMRHTGMARWAAWILAAVVACCGLAGLSAATDEAARTHPEWPAHLRLVSGPTGGEWHMTGERMAGILSTSLLRTNNRPGGGFSNIESIRTKTADIGFSVTCFLGPTLQAAGSLRHIDTQNVTVLANLYPQVLYFILRKEFADKHNITSVESLLTLEMPLRFASLKQGTASEFILNVLLQHGYNTDFDQLRAQGWRFTFGNYAECADGFVSGDIDCFAYTASVTVPLILAMEEHTPLTVLPVTQKAIDIMGEKMGMHAYTIGPGVYSSVQSPVQTLADYSCLIVREDLPDDLVFAFCRTIWEQRQRIAEAFGDFTQLNAATALPKNTKTHPGAVRFWQSVRP